MIVLLITLLLASSVLARPFAARQHRRAVPFGVLHGQPDWVPQASATTSAAPAGITGSSLRPKEVWRDPDNDCDFDPTLRPLKYEDCLWDMLGTDGSAIGELLSRYTTNSEPETNWIEALYQVYGKSGECTISDLCRIDIDVPEGPFAVDYQEADANGGATRDDMILYLALTIGKRYMLYQSINYQLLSSTMADFQDGLLDDVVNTFTKPKNDYHRTSEWGTIKSAFGALSSTLGIVALGLPEETKAAKKGIEVFAALVGIEGSGEDLAENIANLAAQRHAQDNKGGLEPAPVNELHRLFRASREAMQSLLVAKSKAALADVTVAFRAMNSVGGKSVWLSSKDLGISTDPATYSRGIERFLTAWAISAVMNAARVFLHWEPECPNLPTYPQGSCTVYDDPYGRGSFRSATYPVSYQLQGSTTAYQARAYPAADDFEGFGNHDLLWHDVIRTSYMCRHHYGVGAYEVDVQPQWSNATLGGFSGLMDKRAIEDFDLSTIPCFFSLPIAAAENVDHYRGDVHQQCQAEQVWCEGHERDGDDRNQHAFSSPNASRRHKHEYGIDNLGLDDFMARRLGLPAREAYLYVLTLGLDWRRKSSVFGSWRHIFDD